MNSVLLVDDNGLFRDVGEAVARRTACRVLTASTGSDALALARKERPDVVFVDERLTGMSGSDVCRVLKADPRFARTPVVVVAGEGAEEDEAKRAGADETLPRTFALADFFDALRRFLHVFPRSAERSPVQWDVTFWKDGAQHSGTIRDLSRGGFFVRTPVRLPVGARIEASFELPGEPAGRIFVAEAIVVRAASEPDRGLGCRFFRVTEGSRRSLEDCLRLLSLAGAAEPAEKS